MWELKKAFFAPYERWAKRNKQYKDDDINALYNLKTKQNKHKTKQKLPDFSGVDQGKCNRVLSRPYKDDDINALYNLKTKQKLPDFSGVDQGKCNRVLSNLLTIIPTQFAEWENFSWKFQARPHFYGRSLKLSESDSPWFLFLMSYGAVTHREMYLPYLFD